MIKKLLLKILQPLLNEEGKGGGAPSQTTTTEQPALTPPEAELNRMQIERAQLETQRAKALAPYRGAAQEAQIGALQQRLVAQKAGAGTLRESIAGTDVSQQRDFLRQQIIEDALAKVKGGKSYVSPQEKDRLQGLTDKFKSTASGELTSLKGELESRSLAGAKAEGLRGTGIVQQLGGRELQRQIDTSGRTAGMMQGQTLMGLPQENRMTLAKQLESSQRLGMGEKYGMQDIVAKAAGLPGGAGTGAAGAGSIGAGIGGGSLSSTLQQMEAARQGSASQTTVGAAPDRGAQAIQGAMAGAGLGMSAVSMMGGISATGAGVAAGLAPLTGGLSIAIPLIAGAIYGFSS